MRAILNSSFCVLAPAFDLKPFVAEDLLRISIDLDEEPLELRHDWRVNSVLARRIGDFAADAVKDVEVHSVLRRFDGRSRSDRPAAVAARAFGLEDERFAISPSFLWPQPTFHPALPPLLGKRVRRGVTMPVEDD